MMMKRTRLLMLASAALLASCSQPAEERTQSSDVAFDSARAPDVSPTAAPGVAFNYDYDFQLPDERISEIQERHARACEQLGLAKCRIAGMTFGIEENEQVNASLRVKLDPAIARQFGGSASKLVEASDGRLVNLHISGDDVGSAIDSSRVRKAELERRIAELETRLGSLRVADPTRGSIIQQVEVLRAELAAQEQSIAGGQAQLASTPMLFEYYGSGGVPGFRGNPLREAWHTFLGTLVTLVRVLLQALAILVPVALLLGLLLFIWRAWPVTSLRRWIAGKQETTE